MSGGAVFAMDALAHVTAVSTAAATLWQADLTAEFDRGGAQSGGGLAVQGGRVFATTGYGEVVALDAATGARAVAAAHGRARGGRACRVGRHAVYAMSADGSGWALDAASGRVLWTLPAAENVLASRYRGGPGGQRRHGDLSLCRGRDDCRQAPTAAKASGRPR